MEQEHVHFESRADETLYGLLWSAQRALSAEGAPIGVVDVNSEPENELPHLSVETEFAYAGPRQVVSSAVLRLRCAGDLLDGETIEAFLVRFGGEQFTNLCLNVDHEELDVTVCFSIRHFPYWSTNTNLGTVADTSAYANVLNPLGLPASATTKTVTHQLRKPPTPAHLREAFVQGWQHVQSSGVGGVTVYASALPAQRAARLEKILSEGQAQTDLTVSLGLSGGQACASTDFDDLELFFVQHCGLVLHGRSFHACNSHADPRAHHAIPVPRQRGRIKFSFWLKG